MPALLAHTDEHLGHLGSGCACRLTFQVRATLQGL